MSDAAAGGVPAPAAFTVQVVTVRNGESVALHVAPDGRVACPVCGGLGDAPPYDPATGEPSMAWCPSCEYQIGWDDRVPPDAPPGAQARVWEELRERWLQAGPDAETAAAQLDRIGIRL